MLQRHILLRFGCLLCGALLLSTFEGGCTKSRPIIEPFLDGFERAELGPDYNNTGAPYQIVDGRLQVQGAYNRPLWLQRALPRDAVIELDVISKTPDGDIKVELWGDGRSHATSRGAYLATSYVLIFGGWGNTVSAIARLDEHGADRKERRDIRVRRDTKYHWKITRKGSRLSWLVDGKPFLALDDSTPLEGSGHAYLGFNNWQSDVSFDNLRIAPLQ